MVQGIPLDLVVAAAPAAPPPLLAAALRRACQRGLRPLALIPLIVPPQLPGEAIEELVAPAALALQSAAACALQECPGRVELVPCRSLGEALGALDEQRPTLLVGHVGWPLRHALARRRVPHAQLWPRRRQRLD